MRASKRGAAPWGDAGIKYLPDGESRLTARGVTLQQLADDFRMFPGINLHQRITDETGLEGNFDAVIVWTPEQAPGAQSIPPGPDFLEALQGPARTQVDPNKGTATIPNH